MTKRKIERLNFTKSEKKDVIRRATLVGCSILLLPMGDIIKFTSCGIKYTILREVEK